MTATPIPRTIALTLYSDLDVSIIDQMPKGRKPIKTWIVPHHKRPQAYSWIHDQIHSNGVQAFIVCPLITDSESPKMDSVKAVRSVYEDISHKIYPDLKIGLLHGQLSSREKSHVVDRFEKKEVDILVTTPVIEVGIDVKNAAIIVIESAERFGLASLHQLRGRVGRSDITSYCLLFTTHNHQTKRLSYMENTQSGLRLAELDLKLRGPGELYGIKQSGYISLKIASLSDSSLINKTHQYAKNIVSIDPHFTKYPTIRAQLSSLAKTQASN